MVKSFGYIAGLVSYPQNFKLSSLGSCPFISIQNHFRDMTVTLDTKEIYKETDDDVKLTVWDNRSPTYFLHKLFIQSCRQYNCAILKFYPAVNYFHSYLGIKLRKIKTTRIIMSEVFYESISGKK